MKKLLNKFKAGEKGFTLIELLVAIAILGILAAVAIPQVSKFLGSASDKAATTEMSMVQVATVAYEADNAGHYPATTDDLSVYIASDLQGTYTISQTDGKVTQVTYPGVSVKTTAPPVTS